MFEIKQKILKKILDVGNKAALSAPQNTKYRNLRVTAEEGMISFEWSHNDVYAVISVEASQSGGDVGITKPAQKIFVAKQVKGLVNSLSADKIISFFEAEDQTNRAEIHWDTAPFYLDVLSLDQFEPSIPAEKETLASVIVDGTKLHDAVSSIQHAMARDDPRAIINGINFNVKNHILALTATDSFRAASAEFKIMSYGQDDFPDQPRPPAQFEFTLAGKPLLSFLKTFKKGGSILVSQKKTSVVFEYTYRHSKEIKFQVHLHMKTLERAAQTTQKYPNVLPHVPTSITSTAKIHTMALSQALTRVTAVRPGHSDTLIISFREEGLGLQLRSTRGALGQFHIVPAEIDGEPGAMSVDRKYLVEAIQGLITHRAEYINVSMRTQSEPLVLKSHSDGTYVELLMPKIIHY